MSRELVLKHVVEALGKGLRLGDMVVIVRGAYDRSIEMYEDGRFKVSLSDGVTTVYVYGRVSDRIVIESVTYSN